MKKKKVEIFDTNTGETLERLMLSEEQIKLIDYLEAHDIFWEDVRYKVLDDDIAFKEI